MIPVYQESDLYYFDEESADRPCRFIEKFCRHYKGIHAGKPFLLLDWEREFVRTLYGWKRREDNLRRFREALLLTAKGAGKTPLLSACALFMLIGDREAAPSIVSMASTSDQAGHTFKAAKAYIDQEPRLQRFARHTDHKIVGLANRGEWVKISGSPKGRSGGDPHCIIADEMMEWEGRTVAGFELLRRNCFKRAQSIILIATNAGDSHTSYAYQQYERALRVRDGEIEDDTLLPVIYETPDDLDWQSEAAACAANPSMGKVVSFSDLKSELQRGKESPEGEGKYRRLYLSQWPKTSEGRWLDMDKWDSCTKEFDPSQLENAVLYDAVDLSHNNDLSAAVFIWATADKFYVDAHFWIPKWRAEETVAKHSVQYLDWAAKGHITLVESPTIDAATRLAIAAYITAKTGKHQLKVVCYDRWKSEEVVAALEGAGVTCTPVPQAIHLSSGAEALDRRLQEGTIQIQPNEVLRFCAENAQVKCSGELYWPIKPNAKGRYAGTRWRKVDGITALVTGLVEARRHTFANARKMWHGSISSVLKGSTPTNQPAAGKSPMVPTGLGGRSVMGLSRKR